MTGTPTDDGEFTADEVQKVIDRLESQQISHTEKVPETVEYFTREVVEQGTFTPDCNVSAEVSLTLRERITGKRKQDVTAMLIIGMIIGSALERDVPMDSELEDEWRDEKFTLPNSSE